MKKIFFLILLICLFPLKISALELIPNAKSGILIDANSGKVLFEKEKDKKYSIASLTKMVGQIIILEDIESGKIKWSDTVVVSKNASDMGGSQIYLEEGEKISVDDLMKGISISSGNDAIVAMAEYISGSEEKFVERMNKVAKNLKLKNTHFVNCTGLDEDNHYSSSYDISVVARELVLNHPTILKYSSIYEDYLREGTDHKFWLVNTNKLINFYEGADGLKTGHTDDAGYCLAATVSRNKMRLIGVVLGEEDSKVRNREMVELLDYGFNNSISKCLWKKNKSFKKIKLSHADTKYFNAVLDDDLCIVEEKNSNHKYSYNIKINDYKLPLHKGDLIGNVEVLDNNKIVFSKKLVVDKNINKLSLIDYILNNLKKLVFGL